MDKGQVIKLTTHSKTASQDGRMVRVDYNKSPLSSLNRIPDTISSRRGSINLFSNRLKNDDSSLTITTTTQQKYEDNKCGDGLSQKPSILKGIEDSPLRSSPGLSLPRPFVAPLPGALQSKQQLRTFMSPSPNAQRTLKIIAEPKYLSTNSSQLQRKILRSVYNSQPIHSAAAISQQYIQLKEQPSSVSQLDQKERVDKRPSSNMDILREFGKFLLKKRQEKLDKNLDQTQQQQKNLVRRLAKEILRGKQNAKDDVTQDYFLKRQDSTEFQEILEESGISGLHDTASFVANNLSSCTLTARTTLRASKELGVIAQGEMISPSSLRNNFSKRLLRSQKQPIFERQSDCEKQLETQQKTTLKDYDDDQFIHNYPMKPLEKKSHLQLMEIVETYHNKKEERREMLMGEFENNTRKKSSLLSQRDSEQAEMTNTSEISVKPIDQRQTGKFQSRSVTPISTVTTARLGGDEEVNRQSNKFSREASDQHQLSLRVNYKVDVKIRNNPVGSPDQQRHKIMKQNGSGTQIKNQNSMNVFNTPKPYFINTSPEVSARSWCVIQGTSREILGGRFYTVQGEMASLTKIMTCYLSIKVLQRLKLNFDDTYVEISKCAASINGTSAKLLRHHFLNVTELLHALMLPSGNDAALALAEGIGYLLLREEKQQAFRMEEEANVECDKQSIKYKKLFISKIWKKATGGVITCQAVFLREMNALAKELQMERTNYACVHGLPNRWNVSSAKEIAILSSHAMKSPIFAGIVNQQNYTSTCARDETLLLLDEQYCWSNTNLMLEKKGYDGLKTGITDTAGPCLTTSYRTTRRKEEVHLITVLLNSKSLEHRWSDTKIIVKWTLKSFFPRPTAEGEM